MNELETYQSQLPDTIEDLTQFVLIGRSKLDAYKLKLQKVNKLSDAQGIREQTLQDMQDVSIAIVAAEQRIGEILLGIQKAQGKRTDVVTSSGQPEEVTKDQLTSDMGYSRNQVSQYQRLAQNPEIVKRVIDEALKKGEIVTRTQVIKEIRSAKKDMERQLAEKDRRIMDLERREPEVREVVKEVVPEDYERNAWDLKYANERVAALKKDYKRVSDEKGDVMRENVKLKEEIDNLKERTVREQNNNDLNASALKFAFKCRSFLQDVGGYVFISEYLTQLNDHERKMYVSAAQAIADWGTLLLQNITKEK